jgi:hypothetical protein
MVASCICGLFPSRNQVVKMHLQAISGSDTQESGSNRMMILCSFLVSQVVMLMSAWIVRVRPPILEGEGVWCGFRARDLGREVTTVVVSAQIVGRPMIAPSILVL